MKTLIAGFLTIFHIVMGVALGQVTEEWAQRFTSAGAKDENAGDMYVDALGNVYVTGSQNQTPGVWNDIEAVTVKYNSEGVQQWIQNYVPPDSNGAFCRAIHVDAAGNVYVTGETAIFSGGGNDALIIKYSPTGTQLWAYQFSYTGAYCGGFDIITDLTGNVYVTGEYATNVITYNNVFLIKFDPSGNLIGQTFYHSNSEGARKIALDGAGKILIAGYHNSNDSLSFLALKYEQNLDFVWATLWGQNVGNINPIDMVVDINSNMIIAGTVNSTIDYATVKIDPSGVVLWSEEYTSPEGWDVCRAIASDNLGNVYITGETGTSGLPFSYKMTTIKYNPNGEQRWIARYEESGDGIKGYDVAVDNSLNVYLTGSTIGNSITAKYSPSGALEWAIEYNGPSNSGDYPVAVGFDQSSNVYVTATSIDFATGYDIAIVKYMPTATGIDGEDGEIPSDFSLEQNYPNPFNPTTVIGYHLPSASHVTIKVYNALGGEVATLVDGRTEAGYGSVEWNAAQVSSGVYFYQLRAGDLVETKKLTLLR